MKFPTLVFPICLTAGLAFAEDQVATDIDPFSDPDNAPTPKEAADPFGAIEDYQTAPDYSMQVDRERGSFTLPAGDGSYHPGSHFANWTWMMNSERWGNYYVGLVYDSSRPKLGVQLKVGQGAENILKGYAPRTSALRNNDPLILGTAYLAEPGEYPVALLTGDQSNVPSFKVNGVRFSPAPESEPLGQSIDGTITLEARTATTYSEEMRYEPKPEKDCLGFWRSEKDWAEWIFDVNSPGEFELILDYGCGNGNEGSEVAVLVNDKTFKFTVEDTGGFQTWKQLSLGKVKLETEGENKLAIVPLSKKVKAVMDVKKVSLTPTS